ncbi:MAG: AAA family ATPase [Myxococcales bacterium]|nr:AAA family ATPase [Myxococcales bacterium]
MSSDGREPFDPLLRALAAAPRPPVPGVTLAGGRFRLRRRLGAGGFGVVFEAEDLRDGGLVALKWLRQPEADWLYRFKREFRAVQGLSHRGLVAHGDLVGDGDQWFFTMELVDGVDFVRHVRAAPPEPAAPRSGFDESKLRDALDQLLEALAVLHDAGRVHRDIKPSNVLVSREGRVVVIDFGLVSESLHARDSAAIGTPAYMAPEQAAAEEVGPAADVYAVGVMLYEALTGRLPFEGATLRVMVEKQMHAPPPPGSLATGVPGALQALCLRCLQLDPRERPTAAEALRVLSRRGAAADWQGWSRSIAGPLFVGRAAELGQLRAAFARTTGHGQATVVLVQGESGVGKTRLVREFTGTLAAERSDVLLLEGRCNEREAIPYKALDAIVDALSRRLSSMGASDVDALLPAGHLILTRIFPVLLRVPQCATGWANTGEDASPQIELRRRAFRALRELFARTARRHPTVVVIDDLQWADDDGLQALAEVLRAPLAPPLLFIGTVRTGEDERAPERLGAVLPAASQLIELAGLGTVEARALAVAHLRRAGGSESDAPRVAAEARGHPLFVEELARRLALGAGAVTEPTLDDAIRARLEDLEPRARELAELVAISAGPLPRVVAMAAARFDGAELLRRMAVLRASNLVRASGPGSLGSRSDAVEPYHDRVRHALLAGLDAARRRGLHQALAIAFEGSSQADPETLALHWREAGNAQRAASSAERAGDQAFRTLAFDRAATWFEQALDLLPAGREGRRHLRVKLGEALSFSGRGDLAASQFEIAAAGAPPLEALDLRRRTAEQLLRSGHFDRGIEVSRTVLAAIGMRIPRTRFEILAALTWVTLRLRVRGLRVASTPKRGASAEALMRIDVCRSIAGGLTFVETFVGFVFLRRALLLALSSGDLARIVPLLATEAAFVATAGGRARRLTTRLIARTAELAARCESPAARAMAVASAGVALYLQGRFREAATELVRTVEMLRDGSTGLVQEGVTARTFAIQALAFLGSFRALCHWQAEGLRDAVARGDRYAKVNLRIGLPNLAWLVEDRPDLAESEARAALEEWSTRGFHNEHCYALMALVAIALYRGDVDRAYSVAEELRSRTRRSLFWRVQTIRLRVLYTHGATALALAEARAERAPQLLRCAIRDARAIERERMTWMAPFAAALRAGVACVRDARAQAVHHLEAAALGFETAGMIAYAAAARDRLERLRGSSDAPCELSSNARVLTAEGVVAPHRMMATLLPCGAGQWIGPSGRRGGT